MSQDNEMVLVSLEKYDSLLECEVRSRVLYFQLMHNDNLSKADILDILGYEFSAKQTRKNGGLSDEEIKKIWGLGIKP